MEGSLLVECLGLPGKGAGNDCGGEPGVRGRLHRQQERPNPTAPNIAPKTMIDAIAYAAGLLGMVSFLPQIVMSARTRKMSDISWLMLVATFLSVLLYEVYAVALHLIPVVIMNGILMVSVIVTMVLKFRFSERGRGSP